MIERNDSALMLYIIIVQPAQTLWHWKHARIDRTYHNYDIDGNEYNLAKTSQAVYETHDGMLALLLAVISSRTIYYSDVQRDSTVICEAILHLLYIPMQVGVAYARTTKDVDAQWQADITWPIMTQRPTVHMYNMLHRAAHPRNDVNF